MELTTIKQMCSLMIILLLTNESLTSESTTSVNGLSSVELMISPSTRTSEQTSVMFIQPTSTVSGKLQSAPTPVILSSVKAVPSIAMVTATSSITSREFVETTKSLSKNSIQPSPLLSYTPSVAPSSQPSLAPSSQPSPASSSQPSLAPSSQPSTAPSSQPSMAPSSQPSPATSSQPPMAPSSQPSPATSSQPSLAPSSQQSTSPSSQPTSAPSSQPSLAPSSQPSPAPSSQQSTSPSSQPTSAPSSQPSLAPSSQSSMAPSSQQSTSPSSQPTPAPSSQPSLPPSSQPSPAPSSQPSLPSSSQQSTSPSSQPTSASSSQPSLPPSSQPSPAPSSQPSLPPSSQPSPAPSSQPSLPPSSQPSLPPSSQPSLPPSSQPSPTPSSTALTSTPSSTPTPYLIFANRQSIKRVNLDETGLTDIISNNTNVQNAIALDYDLRRNLLFWTEVRTKRLVMSDLDGSNTRVLVDSGLTLPDGIAWDWINQKLYWTDPEHREIEIMDPITGHRTRIVYTGLASIPRGLVVDPNTRWLYWTDWGEPAKIERVSMDGAVGSREVLHNTSLTWPNDLTLDYNFQRLYWVDANLDRIESSNVNGTDRVIVTRQLILHPFSITFYDGHLYWSDWIIDQVLHTSLTDPTTVNALIPRLTMDPMGVKVVAISRQPISAGNNPCMVANGNCSHLCLTSSFNPLGYSCLCPEGMAISEDERNCMEATAAPTTTEPGEGSCVAAGYTSCCTEGACLGSPGTCFCDQFCSETDSCCSDFAIICQDSSTATPTTAPSTTAQPSSNESYIVFANRQFIHRLEIGGSPLKTLFTGSGNNSVAIDFDYRKGYLYWTDLSSRAVYRSTLSGDMVSTVVNTDIILPDGLAMDWITNKVYWTDATPRTITVLDLDRGHRKLLISLPDGSIPRGIAVDPSRGLMFWTDWGMPGRVERASMDGTRRRTIANTSLVWPNDITVEYQTGRLYWIDANLDKIESSDYDGTNRRIIIASGIFHPFSVTIFNNTLFWTDWQLDAVFMRNTSNGSHLPVVLYNGLSTEPMGITVISEERQPLSPNYCSPVNGGCEQLCLLNEDSSFTCACSDGYSLSDDNNSCIQLGTTSPPVTTLVTTVAEIGSCRRAGYTDCCEGGACEGVPGGCFCDPFCSDFDDCCEDLEEICPGQRSVTVTTVVSSTIAFPPSLSSSRIILATSTKLTNSISNRIGASTITSSISNRIGASTITSSVSNRIGVSTITSSISNRIGLSTSSVPSPMSAVTVTREPPHLTPVPTMKPGITTDNTLIIWVAIGGMLISILVIIFAVLLVTIVIMKRRLFTKYETFDNPSEKELEDMSVAYGFKNPLATERGKDEETEKKDNNTSTSSLSE